MTKMFLDSEKNIKDHRRIYIDGPLFDKVKEVKGFHHVSEYQDKIYENEIGKNGHFRYVPTT